MDNLSTNNWLTQVVLLTESGMVNRIIEQSLDPKRFEVHVLQSDTPNLINKLASIEPRIIFLKSMLKAANGFDLCDRLKNHPTLQNANLILLSSDIELSREVFQHHVAHFLTIPFSAEDVIEIVEKLFLGQRNILLVDDSQVLHKIVVPPLIQEGYNVLQAWNGEEALRMLAEQEIDMVIADVDMPKVDGFTLCRAIKSQNIKNIPVLMLSSKDQDEDIYHAFDAGADDYITKPVFINELLVRVRRMSGSESTRRKERILVVEDSAIVRSMITQAFKTQGFHVDEAKHGQEGLRRLEKNNYDLITVDYMMPEIDGYQFCQKVRKNLKTMDIPIIVISARDSQAHQVKMRSTGIQAFLSKPFKPERLVAEVERVLAENRIQQEQRAIRRYLSDETVHAVAKQMQVGYSQKEQPAWVKNRTILSADLVNFCALCETRSAQEVIAILNTCFEKITSILLYYDAIIDKFIGDKVFAIFGHEGDGAHRAICSAYDILQAMPELCQATNLDLQIRIGIHYGQVIMGDIGSQLHRRDFTVIGTNVNITERLQGVTAPNSILITNEVYQLVSEIVTAEQTEKTLVLNEQHKKTMTAYTVKSIQTYRKTDSTIS